MQGGNLDRRITIQTPTETIQSGGGVTKSWGTFSTVWCTKTPQKVMEKFVESQRFATAELGFRVRWLSGITPKMRLKLGDNASPETFRYFKIIGTQEIGRRVGVDILVKEDVS